MRNLKKQSGKHRSVIANSEGRDISQEPEMKDLKELYRNMTPREKAYTVQYLMDQESSNTQRGDKKLHGGSIMITYKGEKVPEMVYCRATKCRHNKGRGKCGIVHPFLMHDDKISVNAQGVCENYYRK